MDRKKSQYSSAAEWYDAAMQRDAIIDANESGQRRAIADAHNQKHGMNDASVLVDQQLYIQGKMDLEEYQHYLQFKHSNP